MKEDSGGFQAYSFDWTPEKRNWGKECECGEPKTRGMEACRRCTFLDGAIDLQGELIAALRVGREMSVPELCKELYGNSGKNAQNGVRRSLDSLMKLGRVARRQIENDVEDQSYGPPQSWVFYLVEKVENSKEKK